MHTKNIETQESKASMNESRFKGKINGKPIGTYTLHNNNGIEITLTNFGQRLLSWMVPDKDGNVQDIVLGFSDVNTYRTSKEKYFGAVIGRYANRIAKGSFYIDQTSFTLETNNGVNHLHGGDHGFHRVVWDVHEVSDQTIEFRYLSKDGEEGYPGNLQVNVCYTLTENNELKIEYTAQTDATTVVNMTHHSYFNLSGEGIGTIDNHMAIINADQYTPIDENMIPTGQLDSVKNTPFDFTKAKAIGSDIDKDHIQIQHAQGYDHNFVLNTNHKNEEGLVFAAKVEEPGSGRTLEVFTNEPGMHFYSGNFLDGTVIGKSGKPYLYRGGFCLETQHYPNSPNQPEFPKTLLQPGETYHSICVYKVSTTS